MGCGRSRRSSPRRPLRSSRLERLQERRQSPSGRRRRSRPGRREWIRCESSTSEEFLLSTGTKCPRSARHNQTSLAARLSASRAAHISPKAVTPPHLGGGTHPRVGERHLFSHRAKWETARMALSVVLAEDSYLMREGVSRLIETDPGITLVATAIDLDSLRRAVDTQAPNVVVTDIRMPPANTD